MPETHVIIQAALERKGALPEDTVVNTWHFQAEDPTAAPTIADKGPGVLDRLAAFYTALATMWSGALSGNAHFSIYDFAHSTPRVPVMERDHVFGTLADSMPTEVCLCLSMAASVSSGQNAARRRGRVYIGPLGRNISTYTSGAPDGRPGTTEINSLLDAGEALATPATGDGFKLAVFSPTTIATGGSVSDAWNVVQKLWVDNAFDIQRRRGARPTVRTEREV